VPTTRSGRPKVLRLVAGSMTILLAASFTRKANHPSPQPPGTSIRSTGPFPSTPSTSAAPVPNPFTIVARWPAAKFRLQQPIDLAVGPDGNLYVTDDRPSVAVISPAGKVLHHWGPSSSGAGDFGFVVDLTGNLHGSIAVGADGNVCLADSANQRVDVFSPTGTYIRRFGSFAAVFDLAVDGGGNVYETDDVNDSGFAIVGSCPPDTAITGNYHATLLFDRNYRLIGAWHRSPFATDVPPRFGQDGAAFGIGRDGSILKVKVALPNE